MHYFLMGVPVGPADVSGTIEWAKEWAADTPKPVIPRLPYTEGNYQWILLYEHVQHGQIDPRKLRRMRTKDLEYLAGYRSPDPDLMKDVGTEEQKDNPLLRTTKVAENITRATRELARRSNRRISVCSAVIGAGVGALGALLVGN